MSVEICRRRFTVDDYYRMVGAGILREKDRVELIEGEVVTMSPIGPPHSAYVDRANHALTMRLGDGAITRVQAPVRLNEHTEPQPDVSILRPKADFYASGHPGPADVLLIIEVADSSLDYDRRVKARIYAECGIREYWVVDVIGESLWRYTDAHEGAYHRIRSYRRGQALTPELLPGVVIAVEDLIGD
jgi:Uma2 family endonuclease